MGDVIPRIYDIFNVNLFLDYDIVPRLGYITHIQWSPDGHQIAVNIRNTLYLLELPNGQVRESSTPMYADFEFPRFVFSPDSRYLVGVTEIDAINVTVLDTSTNQIVGTLVGHTDRILSVNWVDRNIVTMGLDGITRLWNPITFEQIAAFETGVTSRPSFNPDNGAFVARSNDYETVLVRNTETEQIISSFDPIEVTSTFTPIVTCTATITAGCPH